MEIDTAGNQIYRLLGNCDCGLTGGCKNCNPNNKKYNLVDRILLDMLYSSPKY